MARSTAHFSLVAAAPLPVMLLIMVKGEGKGRARDAVALGATLAWAAFCDIYYAVYGVLLIARLGPRQRDRRLASASRPCASAFLRRADAWPGHRRRDVRRRRGACRAA